MLIPNTHNLIKICTSYGIAGCPRQTLHPLWMIPFLSDLFLTTTGSWSAYGDCAVPPMTELSNQPGGRDNKGAGRGTHSERTDQVIGKKQDSPETRGDLRGRQGVLTERVRGRSSGRYRHRSEERSASQNHDVWQRREDNNSSQREQHAVSVDRVQTYNTDRRNHSTTTDYEQQMTTGQPIGSNNIGTIPSRHTNHGDNANPASVVTSEMAGGVHASQTNPKW